MAATLENISQLERRINITLPAQDIDSEVQTRLKRLARDVKMHGFRPGKVPLKVVAQQYENQVRNEVLGDALQKTFGDTVREQNLKVAGYPRFEPKDTADAAAEVQFSATFEVYPEVRIGDISSVAITRPVANVSDAEVEKTLEIMRKQRASYDVVTRAAALGDKDPHEIELIWPGLSPPYLDLFAWLEGRGEKPVNRDPAPFRPVMLAHAIEDTDFAALDPADYIAEWKWDGIRVQAVAGRDPRGHIAARLYLLPLVSRFRPQQILVPILLLHSTRHLGMMFLTRGATYPGLPPEFAYPAAFGDLATAMIAFGAIPLVLRGSRLAKPIVWTFNIVGTLDLLAAITTATIYDAPVAMGPAYWIPACWVPLLLVTHYVTFVLLWKNWNRAT